MECQLEPSCNDKRRLPGKAANPMNLSNLVQLSILAVVRCLPSMRLLISYSYFLPLMVPLDPSIQSSGD
jgi:hypothetical protein